MRAIFPALVSLAICVSLCNLLATAQVTEALAPVATIAPADQRFLDELQERTFRFFWETANPRNGLVPDRWPGDSPSSIAAVGFSLPAYCLGVERGYITRDESIERVWNTLRFLWNLPQSNDPDAAGHRGFFYHFLHMETGRRYWECELSSIDTAILIAGALACREYFDRDDPREAAIRDLSESLYGRVEWTWMQPRAPLICMSWQPERGFSGHDYRGYNEAMLLYVLALGSPTHPVNPAAWDAYTSTYRWADFYGQEHVNFDPLFGHQYSHIWIDFRGIRDTYMRAKGIDYFENSRRATYSQRAYAIDNPLGWKDYGRDIWGLTACDGPINKVLPYKGEDRQFHTYWARGASAERINDDGTLAPTAAGGSVPFAPEICIPALKAMREKYGDNLFAKYGFLDSFNPSFNFDEVELGHGHVVHGVGWLDSDYLGIDQGPILLMTENLRSGFAWQLLSRNANLRRGLRQAGFSGGWLENRN